MGMKRGSELSKDKLPSLRIKEGKEEKNGKKESGRKERKVGC